MTLETLVTILNLNNCFKDSDESVKITAINQVLNDFELDDLLDGTSASKYSKQLELYGNTTYKYLNDILGLNLKEEDVLALFQYSINDFTNDNPLECVFEVSAVANNLSKIFTLGYSTSQSIKTITKKILSIFTINQTVSYSFLSLQTTQETMRINISSGYRIINPTLINPTLTLGYSVNYAIVDLVQEDTLTINYLTTYNIWE